MHTKQHGKAVIWALGTLLTLVLLCLAWLWISLNFSFSDGERAGYVQKLTRKGWVCKTWEGELAMINLPGQPAERFSFSIRDDKVAEQINELMGRRVSLRYEQHIGVPTSCFGDTQYFITAVRSLENPTLPQINNNSSAGSSPKASQ